VAEVDLELAVLGEGDVFGERALLKNQRRYAGVQVTSAHLHCVYISRDDFEHALGCDLATILDDHYKLDHDELARTLRKVRLFDALDADQLGRLIDLMSEIHCPQGEYVLREGDEGDAFYVVLHGTAAVRKRDALTDEVVNVGELAQGASFGERALLRNETRSAGVCATSSELSCLQITRDGFHRALGLWPHELLHEVPLMDAPVRRSSARQRERSQARKKTPRASVTESNQLPPPSLLNNQHLPLTRPRSSAPSATAPT